MSFHIKIGNYRFSKNLGTGSFGKVKLAFNEVTGHKVAIKILNKKKIKQQGVFEKVKREIKVLRLFNHPHITKHYEFIDTPSDIFMVIEFSAGGELFDLISRRERLEEWEARKYFQQIFSSIEYTHYYKISHRDLKPENLLLDENSNIKLIDFGLANSMKDAAALKTACGSPNYAAPEVISGRAYSGVEVDVWSMGVILFAMVCGSLPFDDDQMSMLFAKIKEGKYYMPNFISTDVKDLINRMLQPNPVKRITMSEIRQHPWYRHSLPQYLKDLSLNFLKRQVVEFDEESFKKLFTLNLNLQGKTQDEIAKQIKEKKNTDVCGVYELMVHEKMKKKCFETQDTSIKEDIQPLRRTAVGSFQKRQAWGEEQKDGPSASQCPLMGNIQSERLKRIYARFQNGKSPSDQNHSGGKKGEEQKVATITPSTSIASLTNPAKLQGITVQAQTKPKIYKWQFGLQFVGNPFDMLTLVCTTLVSLQVEWQIQAKEFRLKCRTKINEDHLEERKTYIDVDQEHLLNDLMRTQFLKFYVQVFKFPGKASHEENYIVDIQLIKGTQLVFHDFVKKFIGAVNINFLPCRKSSTDSMHSHSLSSMSESSAVLRPISQGAQKQQQSQQ